jgi:hypothetical protein
LHILVRDHLLSISQGEVIEIHQFKLQTIVVILSIIVLIEEEFEDTKGEIRIRKSKKYREHNDQKKKNKQRSTKYTHKT